MQQNEVIRYDRTDSKTGKKIIAVGILVEENLLSSCAGVIKEIARNGFKRARLARFTGPMRTAIGGLQRDLLHHDVG